VQLLRQGEFVPFQSVDRVLELRRDVPRSLGRCDLFGELVRKFVALRIVSGGDRL
jgi:hypothetical protein